HAQVRDEVAVHHVDVQPVGAGPLDGRHLLAEPGEVGRQDRGCYVGHGSSSVRTLAVGRSGDYTEGTATHAPERRPCTPWTRTGPTTSSAGSTAGGTGGCSTSRWTWPAAASGR